MLENVVRRILAWGQCFSKVRTLQEIVVDAAFHQKTEIEHEGLGLAFITPNKLARWRALTFADKEPDTLRWIDQFSSDAVLWDVGANVGLYSIYAAARGCRVVAFEPSVLNIELLGRNIDLNGVAAKVVLVPIPLSDQSDNQMMHIGGEQRSGALSSFGRNVGFDGRAFESVLNYMVPGIRGADALLWFKLPPPTHIKIDVDGNEHLVLEGLGKLLDEVEEVLVEVNDNYLEQSTRVSAILSSHGLLLKQKERSQLIDERSKFSDTYNQIWIRTSSADL